MVDRAPRRWGPVLLLLRVVVLVALVVATTDASSLSPHPSWMNRAPKRQRRHRHLQAASGCESEADDLANCAAQFGNIDVGNCLSCASGATSAAVGAIARNDTNSTGTDACTTFNETLCVSVQDNCQASCDDDRCGAEFSLYYLCEATRAYQNVTSNEQGGLCDIDCGNLGGGQPSNNGTSGGGGGNGNGGGGGGGGGGQGGSCSSTWDGLRMCLEDQGRDETAQGECDACVQQSIPLDSESSSSSGVDCPALNEQFCSAVTSCESVCAQEACAGAFNVHLRCAAEAAASAVASSCQVTKCGADSATSGAVAETAPKSTVRIFVALAAALVAAVAVL